MRILLFSQFFHPEPFLKGLPFAKELQRRGHDVEVLTGFPNYPGGRVYPGYAIRTSQSEVIDGITVHRVALYPSHDRSGLRRAVNYCSFAVSAALQGPLVIKRPDVIYAYHPPVTTGAAARWLSLLTSAPVVYDVQDLWPETVAATGMMRSQRALRMLRRICGLIYNSMDRIVVLSPGFRDALVSLGVNPARIDVIHNWADETAAVSGVQSGDVLNTIRGLDGFKVLFAGTMGLAQDLDTVLDAARLCLARNQRCHFIFVGSGIEAARLEMRAAELGLRNVRFLPRIPPTEVADVLDAADALLVQLRDDPLFEITIPSKTQAYLAAGKPIIMSVKGDAAALIQQAQAGLCCAPGDPSALAETVQSMARMTHAERIRMGVAGRAFYARELSFTAGVSKFETVFETALASHSRSTSMLWRRFRCS